MSYGAPRGLDVECMAADASAPPSRRCIFRWWRLARGAGGGTQHLQAEQLPAVLAVPQGHRLQLRRPQAPEAARARAHLPRHRARQRLVARLHVHARLRRAAHLHVCRVMSAARLHCWLLHRMETAAPRPNTRGSVSGPSPLSYIWPPQGHE